MSYLIDPKDKEQRGKPLTIDDLLGEDANIINLVMAVTELVGSWSEPEVMAWLDDDVLPASAGLLLPTMAKTVANYRIEMLMERDDSHALLRGAVLSKAVCRKCGTPAAEWSVQWVENDVAHEILCKCGRIMHVNVG